MRKRVPFRLPNLNLVKRLNLKPRSAMYLMFGLFFLVGGFYVVIVNVVANKGTELRFLELNNRDLEAQNERLEVEAARLKSLQVLDEGATGHVQVGNGDQQNNSTGQENSGGTTNSTTSKPVTFVPKLVLSQHYTYLPSYTELAQR